MYFTNFVTIEAYEQFGEVLFMSARKVKGEIAQVELAAATEKGKTCFSELEVIAIMVHATVIYKCLITEGRHCAMEGFTAATISRSASHQKT